MFILGGNFFHFKVNVYLVHLIIHLVPIVTKTFAFNLYVKASPFSPTLTCLIPFSLLAHPLIAIILNQIKYTWIMLEVILILCKTLSNCLNMVQITLMFLLFTYPLSWLFIVLLSHAMCSEQGVSVHGSNLSLPLDCYKKNSEISQRDSRSWSSFPIHHCHLSYLASLLRCWLGF